MVIANKKILITGGAGFIGSTLASRLCEENEIVLYDNLARNTLQHTGCDRHSNVKLVKGDVLDYEAVHRAMQGAECHFNPHRLAGSFGKLNACVFAEAACEGP